MKVLIGSRIMTHAILVAFIASVVGAGSGAAAPGSTSQEVARAENSVEGYRVSGEECRFLYLINQYRYKNGLGGLRLTQTLGASAEHHSVDMAKNNVFSHTLSTGVSWSDNMRNHGYTYNTWRGENIAAGNYSADKTFLQWKNSPGHNANMLSSNFKAIGIGQVSNAASKYKYYWTTNFGGYVDRGVRC